MNWPEEKLTRCFVPYKMTCSIRRRTGGSSQV